MMPLTVLPLNFLAQAMTTPNVSVLNFLTGPQFFIALIAGLLMAFAFQFLLTNLTLAADISSGINPLEGDAKSWGRKVRGLESKLGGWLLFTANTAMFGACFLAVKLTLIQNLWLAAITSVVIWSAYFLLLLWTGSRTVGSAFNAVGNAAGAGLQGVMGTVATALSGSAVNAQIVNTVEASVDAVTRELKSELAAGLAPEHLRENVTDYVQKLQLPSPDVSSLASQISNLLGTPNQSSSNGGSWPQAAKLAAQATTPGGFTSGLATVAQAVAPEDLKAGKLQDLAEQLIQGLQSQSQQSGQQSGNGLRQQVLKQGINTLISTVAQRVDLSDVDVEKIGQQLSTLQQQTVQQASQAADALKAPGTFSLLRVDIENYLLKSPTWYLQPASLDTGFREVLRDPDADPGLVRQQLEPLNRRYFMSVLQRREGLDENRINDLADQLEVIRREVLSQVQEAEAASDRQDLRQRVETYLSSAPKEALTSDRIQSDLMALLADPEASYETLGNRLIQFDRGTLKQLLMGGRQDLQEDEIEPILDALEQTRDRFLNQSQEQWQQLQQQGSELQGRVESYLRETHLPDLLDAEQVQQNLERLANLPASGMLVARAGFGQLDRDRLEQQLAQREDISPEQVHQVIDGFELARDRLLHTPQALTEQAQDQFDRLLSQIADYLRNTNLEELDPEGMRQDLQMLLRSPQLGSAAIRRRFSQVDRDTLARLLSQQGISEYQINQVIDLVLDSVRTVVKAPQRLATRARDQVQDVQSTLADYLQNTHREELNPDGIQRDLQLLLTQPRQGLKEWQERLARIDHGTLVALLAQREDISEQDANQIIDQVDAVRYEILHQAQQAKDQVQETLQTTVDDVVARLRDYLNAMERPELNYDGIKRDMRTLFADPEAGFEALSRRLGQFDRDTLTAIFSTRTDLSEEQVNRVIDQIEAARDSVLHQAQRLQTETEKRINALKQEAQEQANEVRKSVATAAWWLFGTALTSGATAAIAGLMAAGGLARLG